MVLLIDPLNFIDYLHFKAITEFAQIIVISNFIVNFMKQELRIILQIQVPYLNLQIVNQIFNHFISSTQVHYVRNQLLSLLFLFLIFFLFSFYNLNRHYLRLNQDCYLSLTVLFFSILLFFYVVDQLLYLKFLYKDHRDHLLQIILSCHIQVQQYLHFQNPQTFCLILVQQVNCQMRKVYFQNFMKLFH